MDVQQGEGKLTHNQSNEELVQQLVSAASEDETSDSDPVYERKSDNQLLIILYNVCRHCHCR